MPNPLDAYSKPLRTEQTHLVTIYQLNPRDSKKGRLFMPVYDERFPFVFKVRYSYISRFLEKDNAAGNHYHKVKEEILIPLHGEFEVFLEDVATMERETISMVHEDNQAIYIRTGISHKVVSKRDTGILLVLASVNSTIEDEISYKL